MEVQWLRLPSKAGTRGSIPGQRTKVPHVMGCSQKFFLETGWSHIFGKAWWTCSPQPWPFWGVTNQQWKAVQSCALLQWPFMGVCYMQTLLGCEPLEREGPDEVGAGAQNSKKQEDSALPHPRQTHIHTQTYRIRKGFPRGSWECNST